MNGFDVKFSGFAELTPWVLTGCAGLLGRLMFHAKQVQRGVRKPFSWVLFWDIPIALGMGWIALGLGTWLKVPWEVTFSIALAVSYLGPRGIDAVFIQWSKTKPGGKDGTED